MARIAVLCNTYSFRLHSQQPPFGITTNLRENWIFAVGLTSGGKNGTHNVKIYAEKRTEKVVGWIGWRVCKLVC